MFKEDCSRFVKKVTNSREDISPDDSKVLGLFMEHDPENKGYISREGFLNFYKFSTLSPQKRGHVRQLEEYGC